jgi:hypothetical protein
VAAGAFPYVGRQDRLTDWDIGRRDRLTDWGPWTLMDPLRQREPVWGRLPVMGPPVTPFPRAPQPIQPIMGHQRLPVENWYGALPVLDIQPVPLEASAGPAHKVTTPQPLIPLPWYAQPWEPGNRAIEPEVSAPGEPAGSGK